MNFLLAPLCRARRLRTLWIGRLFSHCFAAMLAAAPLLLLVAMLAGWPSIARAQDYSFNLDEYTKSPFDWGGFLEGGGLQQTLGTERVLYPLSYPDTQPDSALETHLTLGLDASYESGPWRLVWRWEGSATDNEGDATHDEVTKEAYVAYVPVPQARVALGKQIAKWGKGYAFNPIAFIDRPKDPEDPDTTLEGFVMLNLEWIQSFSGPMQNLAFTLVALPVSADLNEDYGGGLQDDEVTTNLAAKLYALVWDTDIDLVWLGEGTRSARYGVDFARNLTSAWELHGEWAHITRQSQRLVDVRGTVITTERAVESYLLGSRYLTESETTIIAEYYANGAGYSAEERETFYRFAEDALVLTGASAQTARKKVLSLRQESYGRPTNGLHYGYLKLSQKEPFDWLYSTVSITVLQNLDDESRSLAPELGWTGITDMDMRLRYTALTGGTFTEFGEKVSTAKLEATLVYSF